MILITITQSEKQVVSGIPEYIEIESSVPSNIYYTLDGTDPTEQSSIYVERVYLIYTTPTVTLKILSVSVDDSSGIIEHSWGVLTPQYDKVSLIGKEGINVMPFGKESINNLSVDLDGNPQKESYIDFEDLDIKTSKTDRIGQPIENESTISFINFAEYVEPQARSFISNVSDINFDPMAKVIVIDGYANIGEQQIRVINRPHGTFRPTSTIFDEKSHYDNMASGNFVKYMLNPKTKKIIFYYRESLDDRWITSIQTYEPKKFNFTPGGNSFVFRWVSFRSQSGIY